MTTRRALSVTGLGGAAALMAAVGGATWYYAGRIVEPPGTRTAPPGPADLVELVAGDDDQLTLRGPDAARPGWWGVRWPSGHGPHAGDGDGPGPAGRPRGDGDHGPGAAVGYARVGPPRTISRTVVRPVEMLNGRVEPGTLGVLDAWAAPPDPALLPAGGGAPDEVVVSGPLGGLPAWWWPGPSSTWAVLVHGRSGTRRETVRLVPTIRAAGMPALAVSYRNDPEAPASPDGRSHLGATEWEDVEAAVAWALAHGAHDVVLVGLSMGGACIGELLARSELAARVRALVLDAAVLDWGPVIRRAAMERGLPARLLPLLLPPTMAVAGHRSRIDWGGLTHLHSPEDFDLPTLLFHGTADVVVPVELADAFARTRRDVVRYVRVRGAGHLTSWNHARPRYERALARFLSDVGAARDVPTASAPG